MKKQFTPEDVFTPRSYKVNPSMYVTRPLLEDALKNAFKGHQHIVIHGESGTGKSWLYKKVFGEMKAIYGTCNMANASRLGSITAELKNVIERECAPAKVGYEEEKSAEMSAVVATGKLVHKDLYQLGIMEPFEACLKMLRTKAGSKPAALVLDNLEAAFAPELLKELADLLILCDDDRYASYGVKIVIVGIPSDLKEYYYKTPHHRAIANRLVELPSVSRLSHAEGKFLLKRGFIDLLKYECNNLKKLIEHILWVTDRIPQTLHEYGYEISLIAEKAGKKLDIKQLKYADTEWMCKLLMYPYSVIESHMNQRATKVGRRNQTLFALSIEDGEHFNIQTIEATIRTEFQESTKGKSINVPLILTQLASGERPIVKRSPKGDAFSFVDPRYRIVLRAMLQKDENESVRKIPFSR